MAEREYRGLIRRFMIDAARQPDGIPCSFSGTYPMMPSAVADAMAEHACDSLSAFDRMASRDAWDARMVRDLALRLPRGSVRFLVWDPKALDSPSSALSDLADLREKGLVQVRFAGPGMQGRPSLFVADRRHVLVERAGDPATCFLGNVEIGESAAAAFEILWSRSFPPGGRPRPAKPLGVRLAEAVAGWAGPGGTPRPVPA